MSYISSETRPRIVERVASILPQTAQTAYFTVTGKVMITQIVGEVVTANIGAVETLAELISNPTVGAGVNICAQLDINGDVIGTIYTLSGTLADALIATTSGAVAAQSAPILVTAGTLDFKTSSSTTGQIKWTLHFISLDRSSNVVAA